MGPIVAIIGRPNVGKSSLFNKIIGEDKAIIADFSGLTRDRLYGNFSFKSRNFSIIDTGGISDEKEEMNLLILKEILLIALSSLMVVVDLQTDNILTLDLTVVLAQD